MEIIALKINFKTTHHCLFSGEAACHTGSPAKNGNCALKSIAKKEGITKKNVPHKFTWKSLH